MKIGNWPALFQALTYIIAHPEEYAQYSFRSPCGTTRCVAGWIAQLNGWQDANTQGLPSSLVFKDGELVEAEDAAIRVLNFDPEMLPREELDIADRLFEGDLSWASVLENVRDLANADGVTIPELIRWEMDKEGVL